MRPRTIVTNTIARPIAEAFAAVMVTGAGLPRSTCSYDPKKKSLSFLTGPPKLKVFIASHVHLVPREVWSDYVSISNGVAGWEEMLDRYGVNSIVVDEATHAGLISRLRENENWRQTYSDNVGAVFVRRKAI